MSGTRVDRRAYLTALCRTVPYTITERVLRDPTEASLELERFDGTFLFLDVVGFTAWCESMVADGADGLGRLSTKLSAFFTRLLEEALFPHDGYVIQFGGDSLSVVFRGEDHALRALAAALTMRVIVREAAREEADALHVRVGVTTGEVILLTLGDDSQRSQVVTGAVARRAVSLQGRAEPDEILTGANTAERVGKSALMTEVADRVFRAEDLLRIPVRSRIKPLGDRINDQVEEKIALLEPFVPAPLRERLKSVPDGWRLDGEVRKAIVVFMELEGWSSIDEKLAQNMGLALLRAFRRYGGVLTKADITTQGHRVMVVFGLHGPTDNDAERAVLAALDAAGAVRTLAKVAGQAVAARVGLHVGSVFFGAIGSNWRHDITCIGDAVNVAARAAVEAGNFEVVVTDALLGEARAELITEPRPPIAVKGKAMPLRLHQVKGPAENRSHYVRRRTGDRNLAGREDDLVRLDGIVDASLAGAGRVLSVVGGPGSGKSVVLSRVINRWLDGGGIGLLARCRFATKGDPLGPVRGMFQSYLGIPTALGPEVRDRVQQRLSELNLGDGEQVLVDLLTSTNLVEAKGVNPFSVEGSQWSAALDAIMRFVDRRIDEEAVLYVLEDIHNADSLTLELCRRLTTFSRDRAFLFVATYREENSVSAFREVVDTELRLPDLSLRHATELIRRHLGAHEVDDEVGAFLWRRTGGNPGALVELMRFLRDRSLLMVRGSVVVAAEPGVELLTDVVPESLAQLTLGRLDHLGVVERRMLRIGSAIGPMFGRGVLKEVARGDVEEERIDAALDRLVDEGVVASEGKSLPAYRFREDVTRAVTYRTIPEEERRAVHARIADALEKGDQVNPITLAMHRERAGQIVAALKFYEAAVRVTSRAGLDQETRHLVEKWFELAARAPEGEGPSVRRLGRMAVKKLIAVSRRGAPALTLEEGRRILSDHWPALDEEARVVVDLWLGSALLELERDAKAQMRLVRVYERSTESAARGEAARLLARQRRVHGDAAGANDWLARAAEQSGDSFRRSARVELERILLRFDEGEIDEARARLVDFLSRVRRNDDIRLTALTSVWLGLCELLTREPGAAREAFERARVISLAIGHRGLEATAECRLGRVALWDREPDAARLRLERSLGVARSLGLKAIEAEAEVSLGLAVALTDDLSQGHALCEQALERAQTRRPLLSLEAHVHLARIELLRKDHQVAAYHLDAAAASTLARIPLFAHAIAELNAKVRR